MKPTRAIAVLGLALGAALIPTTTTGAAAVDNPCRLPGGVLESDALGTHSAVACGAVGRLVDAGHGVPLPVQPPGHSVTLGLLYPAGEHTYTVTTDAAGFVTSSDQGADRPDEFPDLPGPGACERDSYRLAGFTWHEPWLYRTTVGTTLATDSQADFDAAMRRSTANIVHGRNTCDMHGGLTAAGAFVGHTTAHGDFAYRDGVTTCTDSDSQNVIDEGDLPGGFLEATLAAFCVWTETTDGVTRAVSADLRLNNGDYNWTYDPNEPACDPAFPPDPQRWRYDVESVLTHEVGHVFGLVNLSAVEDVNQTMFPGVRRCSGHMRSLGRGDLLGLRALYGAP
jgi:hypothetical protein